MNGLLQRVSSASVTVDGQVVGAIGRGLLVLLGICPGDTGETGQALLERLLDYRVFADRQGKMNLSLRQIEGGLLLVPQFTLAAETTRGRRPSFTTAAPPRTRASAVRKPRRAGHGPASGDGQRDVRRRHAGGPGERRAGDVLAGGLSLSRN